MYGALVLYAPAAGYGETGAGAPACGAPGGATGASGGMMLGIPEPAPYPIALSIAAAVTLPTLPSTGERRWSDWNALTALEVFGPNLPSSAPGFHLGSPNIVAMYESAAW